MDSLNEFEIADCIPSQGWCEVGTEVFESLKIFSKLDLGNVVDNVQQSNAGAGIFGSLRVLSSRQPKIFVTAYLISKPNTFGAGLFLPVWIFRPPFEKENQTVNWLAVKDVRLE